eukprot:TRINITY_DN470_c0_g2_i1.p2 TRINITY_DN470_c0_g2~~TRINITY_DN470_c0_g2_i1.p2  ORF type:complete len:423 (+),score=73.80 TRINITY_DN470_c0_g2_i1:100-1368(+)
MSSVLPLQMGLPVCLVPSKLKYRPNKDALGDPSRIHGFHEIRHRNKQTVGWIKFMHPIPFLLFGRDLGASHVFVGHPTVSPQHAVAFWDRATGFCMIQDLESEHGTFLNDKAVSHLEPALIRPKDVIRFGTSAHHFVFDYLPLEYRDEEPPSAQPLSTDARTEASNLPPPPPRRLSNDSPPPRPTSTFSRSPPGSDAMQRSDAHAFHMVGPPRRSTPLTRARVPPPDADYMRADDADYERERGMDARWNDRPIGRGEAPPDDGRRRMPPADSGRYPATRGANGAPSRCRDPRDDTFDDRFNMPPPPPAMRDHRDFDRPPSPPPPSDEFMDGPPPPHLPRRYGPPDAHPDGFRPPHDGNYDRHAPSMRGFGERGAPPPYRGRGGGGGRDYEYDRRDDYRPRGGGRGGYDGRGQRHRPRQNDAY